MKIYRLIDSNEMVTHELRVDDEQTNKYYLSGDVYIIIGENISIGGKPVPEEDRYNYEFVAGFSIKWDMCSHWYFYGEDYNHGTFCDSYYHLCGASSYIEFMKAIAFVTEVAKMNFELTDNTKKEFNAITKLNLLEDCRIECIIKADE